LGAGCVETQIEVLSERERKTMARTILRAGRIAAGGIIAIIIESSS
jgi:hypothetical protein